MRSHLTRSVFRRLLSSQPVVIHRSSLHTAGTRPRTSPHYGRLKPQHVTRRTLFGLFEDKPTQRDLREPLLDPGMGKMLQLDKRIHLIARYPPTEDLVKAFNSFIGNKRQKKQPLEDFHATQVLQTLRVIEEEAERLQTSLLTPHDYYNAIFVISNTPTDRLAKVHSDLAWLVYRKWLSAVATQDSISQKDEGQTRRSSASDLLARMVSFLCRTGQTSDAQQLLQDLQKTQAYGEIALSDFVPRLWPRLLDGYAKEDKETQMKQILAQLETEGRVNSANLYASLLLHYARKDNIEQTKKWATPEILQIANHGTSLTWYTSAEVRKELFAFCLRNKQMDWAQTILQTRAGDLDQEAIFLGAVAAGKSIEELDRMLAVLAQRSHDPRWTPAITVINSLLDFANTNADPYTAERLFALAQKWHAPFDAQTYIHQIRYRLLAADIPGALSSYALLREQPIAANEDWDIMNLLTQALASDPKASHATVMGLAADLSDRNLLFPARTVAALCSYHLRRDEYFELVDLLQTYAYQYSTADRLMLRDLLLAVCLDPKSDTARIWDTYMIFHQVFDLESAREPRQNVMAVMFDRRRPDLATHVFTRMARHSRANTRPDHSTYVEAFIGIAKNEEPDALEVLHNMLKLDTEVEPSTQLRNALMLAYSACGVHWRALEFWEEIATSPEGPSYASLHAAFWACERTAWGHETAKAVWERLLESDVEVGVDLAASYLGSMTGNGLWDQSRDIFDGLGKVFGRELQDGEKEDCIGAMFNASRGVVQQSEIEDWALEFHAPIWERLVKRGIEEDEMGVRRIEGFERKLVA